MTRMEETEALRARTDVHYNCCQSVLVPFADLCGLDKETAFKLGANFGSGMRHGSTCGAVTGALMVLGLAGFRTNSSSKIVVGEEVSSPIYIPPVRTQREPLSFWMTVLAIVLGINAIPLLTFLFNLFQQVF